MKVWFLVTLLGCVGRQICGEVSQATENAASTANAEFSFNLLQTLSKEGNNVFFSPYAISAAVAMTSLGATGNTLQEIDQTCHFDKVKNSSSDPMALHEVFKKSLMLYGQSNTNYSINAANRLFAQEGFEIKQEFKNNTRDYYSAEIEQVVFGNGIAETIINNWVGEQTHDKIKELFKPNSLTSDIVLALVSAIYFKGNWRTKFDPEATYDTNFFTTAGDSKTVKMMSITSHFNYHRDDEKNVQILELPYAGNDISMIVILPQQGELQQLISELDAATLHNWLGKLSSTKVDVKFPKFKLETEYSLKATLRQLGINDLFTNRCNLSDIFSIGDQISINEVKHKAFVQIDESGTEAAAVTGITAYLRTAAIRHPDFHADHPFLFLIRHKYESTELILFVGTFSKPADQEEVE